MKRMATNTRQDRDEPPLDPQGWVDRHGDYLYRYAVSKVRRSEAAEDLVQETLLSAWRARTSYEGRASERSWLTAILKRKVIDWIRSAVRARAKMGIQPDDQIDDLFTRGGQWRSKPTEWEQGTPDAGLHRRDFWNILHDCTNKLPPRLRNAFVLWHLDEEPSDEVCQAMKLTTANLWVLLHRARVRLWSCLDRNWYGNTNEDTESDGDA
jgi:RNA polymerase sigma-70 factor (TIGR02943 family)